jgi:hypothetical protein
MAIKGHGGSTNHSTRVTLVVQQLHRALWRTYE